MNSSSFEILILGSNGALPAHNRFPSAQLINIHEKFFLVDCGEGTQFQLRKYGVKLSRIQDIFITHLHGDHVYGLPGLLTSYILMGREEPLNVYGPTGIEPYLRQTLQQTSLQPPYPLSVHTISNFNGAVIMENDELCVKSLPLDHKVPCCGYLFSERKARRKLNIQKLQAMKIPNKLWKMIEAGQDINLENGLLIKNDELIQQGGPIRSYAYCSDTRYNPDLLPFIQKVCLLYHETTYLHELAEMAKEHGHSTALQAARTAHEAKASCLLTGHYSSRYQDLEPILFECQSVFPNVVLGREGLRLAVLPDLSIKSKLSSDQLC